MAELIHQCAHSVRDERGIAYTVRVYAGPFRGALWEAWLEFESESGEVLKTERETTQLSLADAVYWAEGLEPVFLEGAFERARKTVTR